MRLLEILEQRHARTGVRWAFLVELRPHARRYHVRDLVHSRIVPIARKDGAFGDVIVGRAPSVHVTIAAPGVSLVHAIFRPFPDGSWWIIDQGSTNGTFVNGARIVPGVAVALPEGCIVRFGGRKYAFGSTRLQRVLRRLVAGVRTSASEVHEETVALPEETIAMPEETLALRAI